MKHILITGSSSYIGTSFANWVEKETNEYSTSTVNTKNGEWMNFNFKGYDIVLHVAGLVHIKETKKNADMYYKINRDLAYEIAKKAKCNGVKQFIFMSSMSVYGIDNGVINKDTVPKPSSNYGKSKLQAEHLIFQLIDDTFKVAILRPPMIYGKGSRGNYNRLSNYIKKVPIFPELNNKRSMLYIENLSKFIYLLIKNEEQGLFLPQNNEYVKTSDMVRLIAESNNKKILMLKLFNPLIRYLVKNIKIFNKVFGDLVYDQNISLYIEEYRTYDLKSSIKLAEGK